MFILFLITISCTSNCNDKTRKRKNINETLDCQSLTINANLFHNKYAYKKRLGEKIKFRSVINNNEIFRNQKNLNHKILDSSEKLINDKNKFYASEIYYKRKIRAENQESSVNLNNEDLDTHKRQIYNINQKNEPHDYTLTEYNSFMIENPNFEISEKSLNTINYFDDQLDLFEENNNVESNFKPYNAIDDDINEQFIIDESSFYDNNISQFDQFFIDESLLVNPMYEYFRGIVNTLAGDNEFTKEKIVKSAESRNRFSIPEVGKKSNDVNFREIDLINTTKNKNITEHIKIYEEHHQSVSYLGKKYKTSEIKLSRDEKFCKNFQPQNKILLKNVNQNSNNKKILHIINKRKIECSNIPTSSNNDAKVYMSDRYAVPSPDISISKNLNSNLKAENTLIMKNNRTNKRYYSSISGNSKYIYNIREGPVTQNYKFHDKQKTIDNLHYNDYIYINFGRLNKYFENELKNIFNFHFTFNFNSNKFFKISCKSLDIKENRSVPYNLFRTSKREKYGISKLFNEIEMMHGNNAMNIAKITYTNFVETLEKNIQNDINLLKCSEILYNYEKIEYILNNINTAGNLVLLNTINDNDKLIIYKVMNSIIKFFKKTSNDSFLSFHFPEIKILYHLYHLNMKNHRILKRRWHAGIFLKTIIKRKMKFFKNNYISHESINNIKQYFKDILEIRIFYILDLLKFLDVKKPYLAAYLMISLKSYFLGIKQIHYIEEDEFTKMFNMSVRNLFNILEEKIFEQKTISYINFGF
ncbi:hypothetical protein DMUE_2768 [Dictyocoela muelleri]|nr:hypothetical protein DMUE_2768 [Dictyocoela muelleri]